jgi:hypothetical protein
MLLSGEMQACAQLRNMRARIKVGELSRGCVHAPVASDTSVEAPLEPVKLCECVGKGGCDAAADLLSNPSTWISREPAAAFRREPEFFPYDSCGRSHAMLCHSTVGLGLLRTYHIASW